MDEKERKRVAASQLLTILLSTLKIGCFTFGGGLAMIPMIQNEFTERHRWISGEDVGDIVAAAQTLPGMVAVNVSVLVGYRIGGPAAATVAAFGSVLPSFAVLCIVALFYNAFIENEYVRGALRGISGAVVALFVSALWKMFKKNIADLWSVVFFVIAAALMFVFPSINVFYIIIGGALIGFVLYFLILRCGRRARQ